MINAGNLAVKQAIHDQICMLYLKLEGEPRDALKLAQWGCEVSGKDGESESREGQYKRHMDALVNYEELTQVRSILWTRCLIE